MKAVVFGAGLGTRLRPLTDRLPKPLAPVGPWPLIRYPVETLKAAGITEIAINTFHLGQQLARALGDGSDWGVKITWSHEHPSILGTGGGLREMRSFLGDEPFVVMNGDTVIDLDLRTVIAAHQRSGAVATMVLKDDPRVSLFGGIGYDPDGRVWDFVGRVPVPIGAGRLSKALFTGVQVFSPEVFEYIASSGEVNLGSETYPALLQAHQHVGSLLQRGYWSDLGTAARLLEANLDVIGRTATFARIAPLKGWAEGPPGVFLGEGVVRDPGVRMMRAALIGKGSHLERESVIGPEVVLGEGVVVKPGSRLNRALVLEGTVVQGEYEDVILGPGMEIAVTD